MLRNLFSLVPLLLFSVFLLDSARSEKVYVDSAKACELVHCDRGEHCMNRKFWCRNPPCPSMIYCSKTSGESLKGPRTCESVRCSKGYICLVRVRRCRWDRKCKQQIARCVSEEEYHDGPASCADFHCPPRHRCILKEPMCDFPPCKLLKSCAKTNEVQVWYSRCRTLGCPSEYECFLRRPSDNCSSTNSCKHTPDCTITDGLGAVMNPDCQGWICPPRQECSAMVTESCSTDDGVGSCKVNRTCREPILTFESTSSPTPKIIPRMATASTNIQNTASSSRNSNYHFDHPAEQTNMSVLMAAHVPIRSATPDCNLDQSIVRHNCPMQLVKWNPKNGPIYRTPVYVRSPVDRNISDVEDSLGEERPTDNSIMEWLDYLRLKTGVDAINEWVKKAEDNSKYEQFDQWLTAVRTTLGSFRFEIWLREIKKLTSEYPAFQKWLAINQEVFLSRHHQTDIGNDREEKSATAFPNHTTNLRKDDEQVYETTKNPPLGNETSADINPSERPESNHSVFSVDGEAPNIPQRKDAGPPRIDYGQNLGRNKYQDFSPPKLKNEMVTWYFINDPSDDPQIKQRELDKIDSETKVKSNPSQDDPVDQPLQLDHKIEKNDVSLHHLTVEFSNQENNSGMNDRTHESPVVREQKNIPKDSRPQVDVQLRILQDPMSGSLSKKQKKQETQDSMKENDNADDSTGFEKLRPEIGDQISNRSGHDTNVLFHEVEDPEMNFDQQRPTVSTNPRQFTEKDQRESRPVSISPESMRKQYYQRVQESYPNVSNASIKSRDPLSDMGIKQEKIVTKTYALFAPTADELHIISPWEAVRIFDPEKKTYYTLVKFPPKQVNNQMRIMGYPLVVSGGPSIDQPQILNRDAKHSVNSLHSESSGDRERTKPSNPWNRILQHQQIPNRLVSAMAQKSDLASITEKEQIIKSSTLRAEQQPKSQEQNNQQSSFDIQKPDRPVLTPLQHWYSSNSRAPHDPSEINHESRLLVTNPHNTEIADLEKSLKEYGGTLNSKEYIDAYVDTIIKDALSKVILNWTASEVPSPISQDLTLASSGKFQEGYLHSDNIEGAQLPEKNAAKNTARQDGYPKISAGLETDLSMQDDLGNGDRMTPTSTPNLSTDSMITETDHRHECDSPQATEAEEKSLTIEGGPYSLLSASDEDEEYYSEDVEQQDYYEGYLRNEDEYLEMNSTNPEIQYYDDEEYDGVLKRDTDVVSKLF